MTEPNKQTPRIAALRDALRRRILLLDGATGTHIQNLGLTQHDFGGELYEGCNEYLNVVQPHIVRNKHRGYLAAGADIVETNTFGATPLVLGEFGLADKAYEINRRGAEIARQTAAEFDAPGRPRWVAGSMGPTTKAISVTGGITFEALAGHFYEQARGLLDGGVDYLLLETSQDTRNVKAGLIGIERLFAERGVRIPVAVSGTIEPMGTMLAGQGVEALYASIAHVELLYVGLNCATGPAFMTDHLRTLAGLANVPVAVVPNAGLPDTDGHYLETPAMMADVLKRFIDNGWVNLVGGCCGTTAEHIAAFRRVVQGAPPRVASPLRRTMVSGIDFLAFEDENRPVLVGERTNAVGSRLFKRLITEEKFEEASEIARRQVRGGAQIIDINLANPDRDEAADMHAFLQRVINKVKVPLMIDSTDAAVIAAALPYCQGKSIINSINLEDGEERFRQVVPLARRYGAALIVGTIDEDPRQGMAVTRQRKLEIAQRSYALLTEQYGVPPEDIVFDPLVFPCATGDQQYIGSAAETIEGLRLIKAALPRARTVLGISNVSFGLPAAGREVLNAVFLYHCVQAGLDLAIVNTEKLERYASIPEEERALADNLLFNRGDDPIGAFAAHYRDKAPTRTAALLEALPLDERLAQYIVTGSKDGLIDDLERKRAEAPPLEIINGPLMAGMSEVGRLFNDNKLIVAEVLQSAEAMKAAVGHLEQFMEKSETTNLGTVLLATVKGDVHDIGKNLVDIIFTNNGFNVVNLGIKVAPEVLIRACAEHRPDIIGLSGLLVKSAQQMVATGEDLRQAGIQVPMLVGGAALSRDFTLRRIAPAYGKLVAYAGDAMKGLELAQRIVNPRRRAELEVELATQAEKAALPAAARAPRVAAPAQRSSRVRVDLPLPRPPDTDRHVLRNLHLDEIWAYINPQMLYGKHMGLRGNVRKLLRGGDPKALELHALFERIKEECRAGGMRAHAVYQFLPATAEGNTMTLHLNGQGRETFDFPRQPKPDGLALPDFVLPPDGERRDHVALFVTSAGHGISERARALKEDGQYLMSHGLQALALETAEAAAEWMHATLRALWGFPDPPEMTMTQRFQARYRGTRYSFGYPACPALEDQEKLFRILAPADVGVTLTEGYMMDPEASVSALAFHHPDALYFSAQADEQE
ncbi:MAG: methionine synthase [Candidatus Lambdaproteobacteria bacterium]|nr:methionine synthase [Candidatus Lambdaproteobacteria bacterium]